MVKILINSFQDLKNKLKKLEELIDLYFMLLFWKNEKLRTCLQAQEMQYFYTDQVAKHNMTMV